MPYANIYAMWMRRYVNVFNVNMCTARTKVRAARIMHVVSAINTGNYGFRPPRRPHKLYRNPQNIVIRGLPQFYLMRTSSTYYSLNELFSTVFCDPLVYEELISMSTELIQISEKWMRPIPKIIYVNWIPTTAFLEFRWKFCDSIF